MFDKNELNKIATGQLKELYERVTGIELHRHSDQWEGKCFVCGHTIFVSDKTPEHFYCRHCGKQYRAIDIVVHQYNLTARAQFSEACSKLEELLNVTENSAQYKTNTVKNIEQKLSPRFTEFTALPDEPSDLWQAEVLQAVKHAHDILMSNAGKHEREYLLSRGFTEDTLRKYRIGFNPSKYYLNVTDDKGNPIKASAGFYIPTFVPLMDGEPYESLLRVKVRCEDWKYKSLMKAYENGQIQNKPEKYWLVAGSVAKSLFCAEYARNTDTNENIIFTEGEFDAMTINQCAGDICRAVTFGSHANVKDTALQWYAWFGAPSNIIVCFDNETDEDKLVAIRKHEQDLQSEIIKAQTLYSEETRAEPPVIRHLDKQYHDWNDILKLPDGAHIIRTILSEWFEDKSHDVRNMG